MPIGDLLAEITGGQPASAPSAKPTTSIPLKRKADSSNDSLSTRVAKSRPTDGLVKASISGNSSINPTNLPHRTSSPSTNGQRPAATSNVKCAIPPRPPQQKRPLETSSRQRPNPPAPPAPKVLPPKPSPTTPTTPTTDPSRVPKRGSFKEIMARGAKAQETMGKVGMIQHKPIDKATAKKEREITKPEQKPGPALGAKGKPGSYTGSSRPSTAPGRENGRTGTLARDVPKSGASKDARTVSKLSKSRSGSVDEAGEKKVKKAATATTGYAGTARPRPGAVLEKKPSKSGERPRHGGLLEPPRLSRRRHEDEYDDELDDFIDYDEEEEEEMGGRPRYYDSDGSSDMEAGLSDIDTEERRAELAAREEDRREQALEEKLRREKEERRRRLLQGGR
ncbi:hypothetical protein GGS20DRAFT_543236 [Poronia punctata]|nr:hypothetical protein GGS20DRAFT_543236 [Poronia punctata]